MRKKIILIGGGSHCTAVIDIIENLNQWNIAGIIDLAKNYGNEVEGIKVIGSDKDLHRFYREGIKHAFITIGSINNLQLNKRKKIYLKAKKIGFKFPNIISNDISYMSKKIVLGEGNFINSGVIINRNTQIGNNCIINSGVILEHNCMINDNIHLAPGVTVSGGVTISNNCHIGTGTTIIQNIKIGKNCLIGAGSTVVKNIKKNSKAMGVPAKTIGNIINKK